MSSPRHIAVLATLVLANLSRAATLTPPERRCQDAIAGSGLKILDRSTAILAGCSRDVGRGRLPAGTSCFLDSATSNARQAAATKALERVGRVCTDGIGRRDGKIVGCNEVAACLERDFRSDDRTRAVLRKARAAHEAAQALADSAEVSRPKARAI